MDDTLTWVAGREPILIFRVDPSTLAVTYLSPSVRRILGVEPEDLVGDAALWRERLHPEDAERLAAEFARQVEGRRPRATYECRFRHADGSLRRMRTLLHAHYDRDGAPTALVGFAVRAESPGEPTDSFQRVEGWYRSLAEHMPVVVYVDAVDEHGTALYVSPQIERLLGFTSTERISDPELWVRQLHPDDRERVVAESLRTNRTGEPRRCEYRMIRRDGSTVWVRDEATMVRDEEGNPLYWQGVMLDITEQQVAREALRRREALLEAVNFAAERLLRAASWEETVEDVLAAIGRASGAAKVSLHPERTAGEILDEFAWTNGEAPPPPEGPMPPRWRDALLQGRPVHGRVVDFPEAERRDLDRRGVRSVAVVPVFVGDELWGHLGVEDHARERTWTGAELRALRSAAGMLGATMSRQRADERLSTAEARYRSLVETMPAATYIEPVEGPDEHTTSYVSPQVEAISGYPPEVWTSDPDFWPRILHPDDRQAVLDEDRRAAETGEPFSMEFRLINPTGDVVWVQSEALLVRDREGGPLYWQGVMLDITERKKAEEQLREAEARYRSLVERLPAIVFIEAPDGSRDLYVSPQIEATLGFTSEEWLADAGIWERQLHPDDRPWVLAGEERANETGEPVNADYRMFTKDGRLIWVHEESTLVRDDEGRPLFWQGVMLDITERKKAEEALQQGLEREREAAERLRLLDEMKNTFLAAVSHELRTPLASVLGFAATLEREDVTFSAEQTREFVRLLARNARKLDRLLSDLLDLDRLTRGILQPRRTATDVGALVRRVVGEWDGGDRPVRVQAEPMMASVDPAKLERIVENLLSNADKYSPPGSPIWVRAQRHPGGVLIAVEDAGEGIPDEMKEAIFEPFHHGPSMNPSAPGTGIGLALVARFAQAHGGEAWVEDRPGGGSSFRVFLPEPRGATATGGADVDARKEGSSDAAEGSTGLPPASARGSPAR